MRLKQTNIFGDLKAPECYGPDINIPIIYIYIYIYKFGQK